MKIPSCIIKALNSHSDLEYIQERRHFITELEENWEKDNSYNTIKGARELLEQHSFLTYLTISFLDCHDNKEITEELFNDYINGWIEEVLSEIRDENEDEEDDDSLVCDKDYCKERSEVFCDPCGVFACLNHKDSLCLCGKYKEIENKDDEDDEEVTDDDPIIYLRGWVVDDDYVHPVFLKKYGCCYMNYQGETWSDSKCKKWIGVLSKETRRMDTSVPAPIFEDD